MPLYCAAISIKDAFDTKDMRSTGGADVNYAMDAAPPDSTIVAQLRAKGAIILAKANLTEYNGGGGDPGGAQVHRGGVRRGQFAQRMGRQSVQSL